VKNLSRQSGGDAQLLLDVGHHRVRQARLAEFREVENDSALPQPTVLPREGFALIGKVERLSFFSASQEHECVRPSGLNAALHTAPSWPLSGSPIGLPVSPSHSRAVLSPDAVTMRLPSGLNAALTTPEGLRGQGQARKLHTGQAAWGSDLSIGD